MRKRIEDQQREKSLEHVRVLAIEGLRMASGQAEGPSGLELQRLWHNLASSQLVQQLPGEQLKRLFAAMEIVQLEPRVLVVQEGSRDAYLLVVVRGIDSSSVVSLVGRTSKRRLPVRRGLGMGAYNFYPATKHGFLYDRNE